MRLAWPLFSFFVLALAVIRPPATSGPASLSCASVSLDEENATRRSVGLLRFEAGFALSSPDPRVGGLSSLRVSGDGTSLLAISDCGQLLHVTLRRGPSGALTGLGPATIHSLPGPGGRPLGPDEGDAEGLARDGEGGLLVSFERRHRVWRYGDADGGRPGLPASLELPEAVSRLPYNSGLETLVSLADGRLLLLAEGGDDCSGWAMGWVGREGAWRELRFPLHCSPASPRSVFNPTDGVELPDGSLLVLERRFPPVGARLRRISSEDLERGDLEGREIALLEPPLSLDNFEGLDVWKDASGKTRVLLLSDDNNCAKRGAVPSVQRTLLLEFTLES